MDVEVVLAQLDRDGLPMHPIWTLSTHKTMNEAVEALRVRFDTQARGLFRDQSFDLIDRDSGRWLSWVL